MGIRLESKDRERANNIRNFIRNYAAAIDKTFERCGACQGTGLTGTHKCRSGYSWNGEFCPVCEGTGYVNWKNSLILAICDKCSGSGGSHENPCKICGGKGVLDWVAAMRMGIMTGIGVK